jgi:osmoprotectant transport system ATP-binding protein
MPAAVEFRDLRVLIPDGRAVLDGISLRIEAGATTVLLGRSGSGKTTLLRTVNRMIEPSSGQVLVNGCDARTADPIELRRGIGYVIQETGLFPHFTVERNAALALEIRGEGRGERDRRGRELLDGVGLEPAVFGRRYPHQLSGGQRQRVGLARALAADPDLLLMDEPFGALDPVTRAEMQDMLRGLLKGLNKTVMLVTHDLDEALYLADRIVFLSEGRVIANLTPAEFLGSDCPEVQAYLRAFHRGGRTASAPAAHEARTP